MANKLVVIIQGAEHSEVEVALVPKPKPDSAANNLGFEIEEILKSCIFK